MHVNDELWTLILTVLYFGVGVCTLQRLLCFHICNLMSLLLYLNNVIADLLFVCSDFNWTSVCLF